MTTPPPPEPHEPHGDGEESEDATDGTAEAHTPLPETTDAQGMPVDNPSG